MERLSGGSIAVAVALSVAVAACGQPGFRILSVGPSDAPMGDRNMTKRLMWSPGDQWLLADCRGHNSPGQTRIYDAATLEERFRFNSASPAFAFSGDGRFFAYAVDRDGVAVFDLQQDTFVSLLPAVFGERSRDGVTALALSEDGHWLGVGGGAGHSAVWDRAAKRTQLVLPQQYRSVRALDFVGSDEVAVVTDGVFWRWRVSNGELLENVFLHYPKSDEILAFHLQTRRMVFTTYSGLSMATFGQPATALPEAQTLDPYAQFTASGGRFVVHAGRFDIWDSRSRRRWYSIEHIFEADDSVALQSDGLTLATISETDCDKVRVWTRSSIEAAKKNCPFNADCYETYSRPITAPPLSIPGR